MNPVHIVATRSTHLKLVGAGILTGGLGVGWLLATLTVGDRSAAVFPFQIAISVFVLTFGLVTLGYGVRRLLNPGSLLVVDKDGLVDRFVGRVTWAEIESVRVYSFMRTPFVGVFLNDPVAFAKRQSFLKRSGLLTNIRMRCAPINIPVEMLPMDASELVALTRRFAGRDW